MIASILYALCFITCATASKLSSEKFSTRTKIEEMRRDFQNQIKQLKGELSELQLFLNSSWKKFNNETKSLHEAFIKNIEDRSFKPMENAISSKNPRFSFKCVADARIQSEKGFETAVKRRSNVVASARSRAASQANAAIERLNLVNSAVENLFKLPLSSVMDCETRECLDRLIIFAKTRNDNSKSISNGIKIEMSKIRNAYNQQLGINLRNLRNGIKAAEKNAERKMELCIIRIRQGPIG